MKKETIIPIIILILTLSFSFFVFLQTTETSEIENNTVLNVIDGDTFEIYTSGEIQTVRLLCVNTPEKNEEGYEEAKLFLEDLILGNQVELISSVTDKDSYGRLLRYVYVNGTFVNQEILDNYGELMIIPPETCDKIN